jgi:hypothetical protein
VVLTLHIPNASYILGCEDLDLGTGQGNLDVEQDQDEADRIRSEKANIPLIRTTCSNARRYWVELLRSVDFKVQLTTPRLRMRTTTILLGY